MSTSTLIYPKGHTVRWRADITPRTGTQSGVLAQPWHRFAEFPVVLWDGEGEPHQALPECVEPAPFSPAQLATSTVQPTTSRAWYEYAKAGRAGR